LATYVENTPSFENKIREVAGTAELVVEDGSAVIAKVNVYDDSTYLPLTGNNPGDQAFATDTDILYIWDGSAWQQAGAANTDDLTEGTTNLFYTDARVDARINNVIDSAPSALDTLNELAAALGDDPNFATTVSTQLSLKANSADLATVATSGSYTDLANTPSLSNVATSGDYNDLSNTPQTIVGMVHTFQQDVNGDLQWYTDPPTLQDGNGNDIYDLVIFGTSDQVFSIVNGNLIVNN
jgi:hypothetical protein